MGAREVVVDANHTVVLTSCAFVRRDEFAGAVAIGRSVGTRHQIQQRLCQRVNRNGDTSAGSGVRAGGRITRGWQQSLMSEGVGNRGDRRGCLYFPKPFIVDKEKRAITLQRAAHPGAELIADELRDRAGAQVEVVLSVE